MTRHGAQCEVVKVFLQHAFAVQTRTRHSRPRSASEWMSTAHDATVTQPLTHTGAAFGGPALRVDLFNGTR